MVSSGHVALLVHNSLVTSHLLRTYYHLPTAHLVLQARRDDRYNSLLATHLLVRLQLTTRYSLTTYYSLTTCHSLLSTRHAPPGARLVVQCVPGALLQQTRDKMREIFSTVAVKGK